MYLSLDQPNILVRLYLKVPSFSSDVMSQSDLNLHWSAWAWAMLASSGSQASSIMSEAGGWPVCPVATRERSLERRKILWKICKEDFEEKAA